MHFHPRGARHILPLFSILACAQTDPKKHGEGEEGNSMGPVAFMWPPDRLWTAASDNVGPCGSPSGPGNRTSFPLSQGSVALSIADDAWQVAFRISYNNNPTKQSDFSNQVVSNISDIDPGHQCYKLNTLEGITSGQNATIQLEYWSEFEGENDGKNQTFFACSDVTFVEAKDFTSQVPCFNVTSDDFDAPTPSGSSSLPSSTSLTSTSSPPAAPPSGGLSSGAKAGIAVGSIVGGLLVLGAVALFLFRRGKGIGLKKRESYELRASKLGAGDEEASCKSA
ncbi:hypothetical protein DM02DRAFT_610605 [Periconia macrospinosa]|uniref:Copper acquisition factor BIM1-like domain-containing protein n=1 Tax=Periconia macrospinosa TaxID=97972 RepID=A0A2V1E4X4_9PLEO|nr:hypothetical protein DM02DRAFT_610605 [Periconia macrospinosa]